MRKAMKNLGKQVQSTATQAGEAMEQLATVE